ncbi:MAG TPA: hypothetical protein VFW00_11245 [Rhodocyclaceae bacterium]|nr:hypothetical protein [Rhodocyclaceae bacterium]
MGYQPGFRYASSRLFYKVKMKLEHLPKIGMAYWITLIIASILGANTGDFLAGILGFGHVAGLPILIAAFLAIVIAEKFDARKHFIYFWLAIIVVRTAATNIGDIGHDLHINALVVMAILAAVLIVTLLVWKKSIDSANADSYTLAAHPLYWWTMLVAGALGTVIGDYFSFGLHLGNLIAACVLGVVVAGFLFFGRNGKLFQLAYYWATVVCIRSAGTAAGDFFAHKVFTLASSTAIFGIIFVLALIILRERPLNSRSAL